MVGIHRNPPDAEELEQFVVWSSRRRLKVNDSRCVVCMQIGKIGGSIGSKNSNVRLHNHVFVARTFAHPDFQEHVRMHVARLALLNARLIIHGHEIAAFLIRDRVIIAPLVDDVVPGASGERIPSVIGKKQAGTIRRHARAAQQPVISIPTTQLIVPDHICRRLSAENQRIFRVACQDIIPRVASDDVIAAIAVQIIIPRATIDRVIPIAAGNPVASSSAGKHIRPAGAEDDFPSGSTGDCVISFAGLDGDLLLDSRIDRDLVRAISCDDADGLHQRLRKARGFHAVVDDDLGFVGRIDADGDHIIARRSPDPQHAAQQRRRKHLPALQCLDNRPNRIDTNASL